MEIIAKPARNRNERIYIFNWETKEEFNTIMGSLMNAANQMKDATGINYGEICKSLISRTDDKYSNEDHELSGMLFEREFLRLVSGLIWCCDLLTEK